MTLQDALAQRIRFVRLLEWADPDDHIELPLLESGGFGPWCTLHSPSWARIYAHTANPRDAEMIAQPVLIFELLAANKDWVPYYRPAPVPRLDES